MYEQDLGLNNLQGLRSHKTQPNLLYVYVYVCVCVYLCVCVCVCVLNYTLSVKVNLISEAAILKAKHVNVMSFFVSPSILHPHTRM